MTPIKALTCAKSHEAQDCSFQWNDSILGESLKDDLGINPPPPLLTVSGGMTQLSDDYLQGLSIDSGGTPNFFHDKSLNDDAHTVNMGGVQARGWGSNLGSMLINTRSNGSGRSGGSSGGKSPGYFNNNELSELFSIVRGKPIFGASGTNRRQQPVCPRIGTSCEGSVQANRGGIAVRAAYHSARAFAGTSSNPYKNLWNPSLRICREALAVSSQV